jgi:hypothetical protein
MKFPHQRGRLFELACLRRGDFSDDRIVTLPYGVWQGAKRRRRLGSN